MKKKLVVTVTDENDKQKSFEVPAIYFNWQKKIENQIRRVINLPADTGVEFSHDLGELLDSRKQVEILAYVKLKDRVKTLRFSAKIVEEKDPEENWSTFIVNMPSTAWIHDNAEKFFRALAKAKVIKVRQEHANQVLIAGTGGLLS